MRCFVRLAAVVLGLIPVGPVMAQPAPVKDPAALFPADTLFYAELTKPAEVARDLQALTKGSVLDDLPAYLSKLRDRRGEAFFFDTEILGIFGTYIGPEMLTEAKRLHGAALAVTGFDKNGNPEIVGVILAGESNVPGLILRQYLAGDPSIRLAGQVEGVNIYTEKAGKQVVFETNGLGAPLPPAPDGACYAQLPGLIVIGTSKEAVGSLIRRAKQKDTSPSLANAESFKEASELRRRPGLYFFANPVQLADQMEASLKKRGGAESADWALIKELVNPKAIRTVSGSLALSDGHLDLQIAARLAPKQTSPLLDLFADRKVDLATLQPVAKDAALMVTLPVGDGEQRLQKLLAAADAVAKASGQIGAMPSEFIKEIESKMKMSFGKELAAKIAAVTIVIPAKQELPKGGTAIPMLIVTGTDSAALQTLEEVLPALVGLAVGDSVDPVTETVKGMKIRSLPGAAMPWKTPLHDGRNGAVLVIGQDRKLVAASLNRALKDSLAADPRFLNAVKYHAGAAVLASWQWAETLAEWVRATNAAAPAKPPPTPLPPGLPAPPSKEDLEKLLKPLVEQGRKLPPLIVSLSRQNDEFRVSVRQAELGGAAAKLLDGAVHLLMNGGVRVHGQFGVVGDSLIPVPIKD